MLVALVALAALLAVGGWLRASLHEAEAGRLAGAAPERMSPREAERALAALRAAERWQPDAGPRETRGVILLARGRPADAAAAFEAVVAAEPRNGVAWAYLSRALGAREPARAARALGRAQALLPRTDEP